MAERVYFHIGLPKTATTYLQSALWGSRDQLRREGVLLPGDERRDHLWASRVVRELVEETDEEFPNRHAQRIAGSWERLLAEIAAWPGTAVISHEFFAAARAGQASAAIEALAPAEVHLVVTAREPLGLFTASWQESLKNRGKRDIESYSRHTPNDTGAIWNWRTLDVRAVLRRWARDLPPEQVHVLPLPGPDEPRDLIWDRFASLIGLTGDGYDLSATFPNESMGVVEAETLRRINRRLKGFAKSYERGVWLRTYLADERLVPRGGERFWPPEDRIEECRARGRAAVDYIKDRGFDVVGDLDRLLVPETLPERRTPASVTDAEVAEVALDLVAGMLGDLQHSSRQTRKWKRRTDKALDQLQAIHNTRLKDLVTGRLRDRREGVTWERPYTDE